MVPASCSTSTSTLNCLMHGFCPVLLSPALLSVILTLQIRVVCKTRYLPYPLALSLPTALKRRLLGATQRKVLLTICQVEHLLSQEEKVEKGMAVALAVAVAEGVAVAVVAAVEEEVGEVPATAAEEATMPRRRNGWLPSSRG